MLVDFHYYVKRFKHLDYTKAENRQTLIDTFVNRVTYLGGKKGKICYKCNGIFVGFVFRKISGDSRTRKEHGDGIVNGVSVHYFGHPSCRNKKKHRAGR